MTLLVSGRPSGFAQPEGMRCPTCKRELPVPATICPHDGAYLLAPLADTLKRGPLSLTEATRIAERLCVLLAPVHAAGRTHARITPDNVFFRHVGSDLTVQITDVDEPRPAPNARYSTPERARGEREDHRADIYSLGILLHHMIAGAPPFDSGTEAAILKKHAETEPGTLLALELQDVPDELDSLIKGMLAKQPSGRPESVAEIRETLENIDTGSTITGAKIAALGVVTSPAKDTKDTDPGEDKPALAGNVLDEPTVETKQVFDTLPRDSQNPTLFNMEKKSVTLPPIAPPAATTSDEHPTSLEIDPYGDTVLRARPKLGVADTTEADADTRLKLTPRAIDAPPLTQGPLIARTEADTEPPKGPKPPEVKVVQPTVAPRGPTVRTEAPPNRAEQQTRLALMVLIAAMALVAGVLSFVLLTR